MATPFRVFILLGAPGAGKGTQAEQLCQTFKLTKVATGDILRAEIAAQTALGLNVEKILAKGELVPDEIMIDLLKKHMVLDNARADEPAGFLLDGFPRTETQARALSDFFKTQGIQEEVISIGVPDETIIERMSGRWVHLASGRTYHVLFNPPKVPFKDDITGEPLIQRKDDTKEVVQHRLGIYHQQTEPVIEWYRLALEPFGRFHAIDGLGSVASIYHRIIAALSIPKKS